VKQFWILDFGFLIGRRKSSKVFHIALAAILFPLCSSAYTQQLAKIPRIGFVSATGDSIRPGPQVEGFRQGLRDFGYIEGKNILVEYRYIEGNLDRVPDLVADLVELKVDVLAIGNLVATRAAKQATNTIPIVMVATVDPVATGLVDSLARPGRNITGLTRLTRELNGKRLELLKEAVPAVSRVGILWENAPGPAIGFKEYETAARALKMQLQSLQVQGPNPDLEGTFRTAGNGRANGLITVTGVLLTRYAKQIADLAIKNRMPSMYERIEYAAAGGLVSYSANDAESFRRAAYYVDKILKGAKAADLPVEQPTKFELVINLKTAKQIGVTIPPNVLARADRVIK
jgi:putative ABC transport system substrate-binding protein